MKAVQLNISRISLFLILSITIYSCATKSDSEVAIPFTDTRDGKEYQTVKIGGQIWMSQNLNYVPATGSRQYNNSDSLGAIYGRLYNWNTALTVAPAGWHLPNQAECQTLLDQFSSDTAAYNQMVVGGASGFNASFSGMCLDDGTGIGLGELGGFWTSDLYEPGGGFLLEVFLGEAGFNINGIQDSYSVRCIKN